MLHVKTNCLLFSIYWCWRHPGCQFKYVPIILRSSFYRWWKVLFYWRQYGLLTILFGHCYVITTDQVELHFCNLEPGSKFRKLGFIARQYPAPLQPIGTQIIGE